MSFLKDMLVGQEGTPAQLVDLRTDNELGLATDATNVLRDLIQGHFSPRFDGAFTAGPTGQESQILAQLDSILTSPGIGPSINTAQNAINRLAGGGMGNPLIQGIAATGAAGPGFQSLGDLFAGRTLGADSPMVQNQIRAATRPLFEVFQDDLGQLTSAATQAGQFVQPGSSSPFELAKSRLQTGLANAIADTSANVVTQNFNNERQRQLGLTGLLGDTFQRGESLALNAANSQMPFQRGQLSALMDGLQVAALPRQITQMGLDRGLQEFDRQQRRLLDVLNLGLSGSRPNTATIPGMEGTTGLLGGALQAGATAFGGPLGGALADFALG